MVKLLLILSVALVLLDCGRRSTPTPTPTPTPLPTATPTPLPTATPTPIASPTPVAQPTPQPTPLPTPAVDLAAYTPPVKDGPSVTISGDDFTNRLQAAQDDPAITTVHLSGGASITRSIILRKHTTFDSSTYSCDATDATGIIPHISVTDYGCFLVADGVLVEGTWQPPSALTAYWTKGDGRNPRDPYLLAVHALTAPQLAGTGTTILESTYTNGGQPSIAVFQALGDACCAHSATARNIMVRGFHIKGRQQTYDGGVRSTIQFGNCHNCAAVDNYLEDTASIGITFGGSALEFTRPDGTKLIDNFSNNVVAARNIFSGVAAANTATINTENAYIFHNYHRRPGHHSPLFGGGICGHDHETNSTADHTRNIWVYNNLYDYEDAALESAGNAICLQDPYFGTNHGRVTAANNTILGGREDIIHRYLSNGILLNGLRGCLIANNYIFRTAQNAIQAYTITGCTIQDNLFDSTGGGGNATVDITAAVDTTFRRNHFTLRPGLAISTQAGFVDRCGRGNIYENNAAMGQPAANCP